MNSSDFAHLGVLIVDGAGRCDALLRAILSQLNISRIVTHAAGAAALSVMEHETFDAVFCGEDNIEMNPVAFLKALRRNASSPNRAVPIILVSGHLQRRQVELLRDCGANDVLITPASAETVARKLRALVFAPRPFIAEASFVGPDRRYRVEEEFQGKERRLRSPGDRATGMRGRGGLH